MKTYGIKIKDFAKAAKAAAGRGTARLMVSPTVLTDGRAAVAVSELCADDRAALLLPVEMPLMPAFVNCTTEEQAAQNNADIKAAGAARDAASAHNAAAIARLALLSGFPASQCSILPAASDKIFIAPEKLRAFRFTGLIYAPAAGTDSKNKDEVCIFEDIGGAEDHKSRASYNLSDPAGRSAYEHEKAQKELERAARLDAYNEPEAPRAFTSAGGFFKEENRAPGAPRQIGVNRKYVEFFCLGADLVYMDAEKDLSMLFIGRAPVAGAAFESGKVVMPMRGA